MAPLALRVALVVQGLHVAEHVALTATSAAFGRAVGLSTFLGLVVGPVMTSFRVWFHLAVDAVATWYALAAAVVLHRGGLLLAPIPGRARPISGT